MEIGFLLLTNLFLSSEKKLKKIGLYGSRSFMPPLSGAKLVLKFSLKGMRQNPVHSKLVKFEKFMITNLMYCVFLLLLDVMVRQQ